MQFSFPLRADCNWIGYLTHGPFFGRARPNASRFCTIGDMSFLGWMGIVGALLLFMALSSAYLRKLPITTSAIYLGFGLVIGPVGLGLVRIDFVEYRVWFELLTEIAVII